MIPRYLPALDLHTAAGLWALTSRAADSLNAAFTPDAGTWHVYGFERGRHGLTTWLRSLGGKPGGHVVVSAQICPAVRHAIRAAGLEPVFVDIDTRFPTPSAAQFAAALSADTVAVVVAPFYGYIQQDWTSLPGGAIGSAPLCLDMAQGILLEPRLAALIARSAAVLYSFSIGKGLDIGGAALFTRAPLPDAVGPGGDRVVRTGAVLAGLVVRTLAAAGLYRAVLPLLERAVDQDHERPAPPASGAIRDVSTHGGVWAARAAAFAADVRRARQAARRIAALPSMAPACRDVDVYCDEEATHLRQVIRLQRPQRRAQVLAAVRRLGVDCAPAGEPLPPTGLGSYPNAERFIADAIRLPFLGRLTDQQQLRVEHALEAALA